MTQVGSVNERSWWYAYDALDRLKTARIGALVGGLVDVQDATVPTAASFNWVLDPVGNWTGDALDDGYLRNDYAWGVLAASAERNDAVNLANQITSTDPNDPNATLVYDLAGNLVFDGRYFYQYDGFNRLVQINLAGDLTGADFDPNNADPNDPNHLGELDPKFWDFTYEPPQFRHELILDGRYFSEGGGGTADLIIARPRSQDRLSKPRNWRPGRGVLMCCGIADRAWFDISSDRNRTESERKRHERSREARRNAQPSAVRPRVCGFWVHAAERPHA